MNLYLNTLNSITEEQLKAAGAIVEKAMIAQIVVGLAFTTAGFIASYIIEEGAQKKIMKTVLNK